MMGRLSMNKRDGHFFMPSNFALAVTASLDPLVCRRYWLSHYLPSIAMNAANSDISKLAYRRSDVVTISVRRAFQAGGAVGSSSGETDRLRLRRVA